MLLSKNGNKKPLLDQCVVRLHNGICGHLHKVRKVKINEEIALYNNSYKILSYSLKFETVV